MKPQKFSAIQSAQDSAALRANFEDATLWTKLAYCQILLGFLLFLYGVNYLTSSVVAVGGIATEICLLIAFFSNLLAVTFVVCLVYIKDARDNKLIETSVMFFCFLAALMLAIALSVWGGDAANQRQYINMVPVGIAVTSVVLSLSGGIFATLELFNVWSTEDLLAPGGSNKVHAAAKK